MRALLSVWDKRGLVELAEGLAALGVELVASGGTAAALRDARHRPPRGRGGHRVARDALGAGEDAAPAHPRRDPRGPRRPRRTWPTSTPRGSSPIDLVVCNLYPFRTDPSIALIDVGGPTMVRAAAKNHAHVGVLVDPDDYDAVLAELRDAGRLSGRDTGAARAQGVRAHRRLRRGDRLVVRRRRGAERGAPRDAAPHAWSAPSPSATARTPTSAARATGSRGRPSFWETVHQHARRRAQLPQPLRRRRRVAARPRARRRRRRCLPRCS